MTTPQTYITRAHARMAAGDYAEAEALYTRGLALGCKDGLAWLKLGNLHMRSGRAEEAVHHYLQAAALSPGDADARFNLGVALGATGRHADADNAYAEALTLKPNHAGALANRTAVLHRLGRLSDALFAGSAAVEADAGSVAAWNNLCLVLLELGRMEEAVACIRHALALDPRDADSWNNCNRVLWEFGRVAEAETCARQALALDERHAPAWMGLANALYLASDIEGASTAYERAVALEPEGSPRAAAAHSAWLGLLVMRRHDPAEVYAEHRRWGRLYADPLTACAAPHANDRDPERKLTIGYVSGDLREHAISFFIEPVLKAHDRGRYRVLCYDNWNGSDAVNTRLRGYVDGWCKTAGMDDDALAARIRADGVDVLVDLSGHTLGHRLLALARKPAPVQANWLGYMHTSGMRAMDYHITDAYLDPPGATEPFYTEQLLRLTSAAAFMPSPDSPPVNALPALERGYVTFLSVNNYSKIGDDVIAAWCRILERVPGARLILVAAGGDTPEVAGQVHARFASLAAQPSLADRVEVRGRTDIAGFLRLFLEADIALDPFPYSGGTTSLHTLWMGLPIVALEGESEISRSTSGMLRACGLDDFVTGDIQEYVECAVKACEDTARLAALRGGLRERFGRSALCNAAQLTRELEGLYREMWRSYLAASGPQIAE